MRQGTNGFVMRQRAGERVVTVGELPVGDQLRQLAHHVLEVPGRHDVGEREPDGGEFARQVHGVGLGPRRDLAVALDVGAVSVVLPVLREQDQRRRVRGLRGESQIEQDERIRVPVVDAGESVENDPADYEYCLAEQEPAGAEEPRDRLRKPAEGVRVVPAAYRRRAARRPYPSASASRTGSSSGQTCRNGNWPPGGRRTT